MARTSRAGIFTGRVGSKMKPITPRGWSRRIARTSVRCNDGPYVGERLSLSSGDPRTLVFVIGGAAGHYANGAWMPA